MDKKTMRMTLLLCICLVFALVLTGCGNATEKATEKLTEKIIEDAIKSDGGDAKVNIDSKSGEITIKSSDGDASVQIGGKADWPKDIPGYVPQFKGDITSLLEAGEKDNKHYSIYYENIKETKMDAYAKALEDNGWTLQMKTEMGDAWMIQAMYGENVMVMASINEKDKTGALVLAIEGK
jgi:hypothetical protein